MHGNLSERRDNDFVTVALLLFTYTTEAATCKYVCAEGSLHGILPVIVLERMIFLLIVVVL